MRMGELLCLRVIRGSATAGPHHSTKAALSGPLALLPPPPPALQYFFGSSFLRVEETNTNKTDTTFMDPEEKPIREGSLPRWVTVLGATVCVCGALCWDEGVFLQRWCWPRVFCVPGHSEYLYWILHWQMRPSGARGSNLY